MMGLVFIVVCTLLFLADCVYAFEVKFRTDGHNVFREIPVETPVNLYGKFYKRLFVSIRFFLAIQYEFYLIGGESS